MSGRRDRVNEVVVLGVVGAVGAAAFLTAAWYFNKDRDNFIGASLPTNAKFAGDPSYELGYKPGFLPAYQGPYFQGMPPSVQVENAYHSGVLDPSPSGCSGDYGNFECLQKQYYKAVKGGATDKADLICYSKRHNENEYYQCLDGVYGNYVWGDRPTGTDSCVCWDAETQSNYTGTVTSSEGDCFCPGPRPMHDRRPVDQNDDIVDRV